jgi:hypothetical protein
MADHVPVRGLFETHLTVSDLQRSVDFYRDAQGITPLSFFGTQTNEPSVIGWMPAAALDVRMAGRDITRVTFRV